MQPSNGVQRFILSGAALLLIGGLSVGQERNSKDWGSAVQGLQMRLSVDQTAIEQSKSPTLRVELRNTGEKDLLLNLGTRSGERQCVTAVSLILENVVEGSPPSFELWRTVPVSDAETKALSLPLPVGATFSFTVRLDDYRADYRVATSSDLDEKLKPGTYLVAAHFNGFIAPRATYRTSLTMLTLSSPFFSSALFEFFCAHFSIHS